MVAASTRLKNRATSINSLMDTSNLSEKSSAHILKAATEIANQAALDAAAVDRVGDFPAVGFKQLADADFLTAPLHTELGGIGLGFESDRTWLLLQILKQIGRGNLSLGRVFEGHVNALQLLQTFGSPEQIQKFATEVHAGKVFGVWSAEAADGVKLHPLEKGYYRMVGSKTFCSGSGWVERPFVGGLLPDGQWQMCIVPTEKHNASVDSDWWQPLGMKGSASYKVDFTGVEVGPNEVIGQPGQYLQQPWLSGGVIRFAAVQLGGAEALFDATRVYLQALGRTEHPHQQARLGKMAIALQQGNLWLQSSAAQIESYAETFGGLPNTVRADSEMKSEQLVAYCNMVRTAIEQICMDMMQLSERSIGALGLLPPHPMERLIRDLTLYLRQPVFDLALTSVGQHVLTQTMPARELWSER